MSFNRYIYVCRSSYYQTLFSKRNSIIICCSVYCIGLILVLLNQAGIGDHSFDRKSLECIWDRMANFSYTVVFSVTLVWIPCLIIGVCYLRLFLFVREHRKKVLKKKQEVISHIVPSNPKKTRPQLAKTFMLIYAVFITCWAPYALTIVLDIQDSFPYEVHLYITIFAHLHPSVNWLIYYFTHRKISQAYCKLLGFRKQPVIDTSSCYTTRPKQTLESLSPDKLNRDMGRSRTDRLAGGKSAERQGVDGQKTKFIRHQNFQSVEEIENGLEDSGIDCLNEDAESPPKSKRAKKLQTFENITEQNKEIKQYKQ